MISKQDILERAREWQLRPEVVEKDYVLGWLLAAIAQHEETSDGWILKGGTCVKKCFFETYRFSEDLDFSLLPEAAYSEADLRQVLTEITDVVREWSGIEFSADALAVRARADRQSRTTFEGKIGYRGPLAMPGWPRILFDLTQHEPVVDEPVLRLVLHPYPDALPADALVRTYSMEELMAEKVRALYERCRPRDLYDVVYVLGDSSHGIDLPHSREVFEEKCAAKQLTCPSVREIVALAERNDELHAEWANMLAHQLPQLPPMDGMLGRLAEALAWLAPIPAAVAAAPPPLPSSTTETIIAPDSARVWRSGIPLEAVRFAGANHLLVRFVYSGKTRTLEPYSLRRSGRGNLLLYGWELESGQIKAFDVAKISQLSTTDRAFTPRYRVEFSPGAALAAPMRASVPRVRRTATRPSRVRRYSGPTYVYECPMCNREFRHQRRDSTLRRHKGDGGWYCPGRRGHLVRVE